MISLRLKSEDEQLIKDYAQFNDITVSDLIRDAVISRIEDEYDRQALREAMAEFNRHPVMYSHEEAWKMIEGE